MGFGIDRKAVSGCPVEHGLSAAPQHGDVECANFDLLQDFGGSSGGPGLAKVQGERLRMGFAREPLQRPASTLFDFIGNGRQRNDPAEAVRLTRIAEAGHVPLDAVMPGDERRRPFEPDRAVGGDQPTAGGRRERLREKDRQGRRRRGNEFVDHVEPPVPS